MKDLIMKIIGIDAETQKRAVVSIITFIVDGLYLFGGITIPDEKVDYVIKGALALITALVWIRGFYMNENYTPEGCEGTGYTRIKKLENSLGAEPVEMVIDSDFVPVDESVVYSEDIKDEE